MFRRHISFCLWASATALFCLAYGFLIEPRQLKIRQVEFLSDAYIGPDLKIGLITDIHIGGIHVPAERVSVLVERMNRLTPDVVLLPGDFVNGHASSAQKTDVFNASIARGVTKLGGFDAPTYATLGNHDVWYDRERMTQLIGAAGITLLENKSETFGRLCLVGLEDHLTSHPDRKAYDNCKEATFPLVLTHSPEAWRTFRSDTVLVVAGHTHGGQINLPILGRRVNSTSLGPEYSYGFSKLGGVNVFVSAGIGTSILPARFRAPPEIVLITLRGRE